MHLPLITITPFQPSEVPTVQSLIMGAVYRDFGFSYNPDWHYDVDHLDEVFTGRNVMLVARADGEIIGCAGLRMGAPVTIDGHYEAGDMGVAQIVRLVVREDWRRKGIARALIETLIPYAAQDTETNHLYFHTSDTSGSAMPFWESLGATMIRDDRPHEPVTRTVHYQFNLAAIREGLPSETPAYARQRSMYSETSAAEHSTF